MQSTESVHRNRMAERFSGYLFRGLLLLPWIVSMGIAFLFVLPVWVTEKYRKVFWFTIYDFWFTIFDWGIRSVVGESMSVLLIEIGDVLSYRVFIVNQNS